MDHHLEAAASLKTEEEAQMRDEAKSSSQTHSRKISRLAVCLSGMQVTELHDTAKASLICCTWQAHRVMVILSLLTTRSLRTMNTHR